jgi:hypothetical protein
VSLDEGDGALQVRVGLLKLERPTREELSWLLERTVLKTLSMAARLSICMCTLSGLALDLAGGSKAQFHRTAE